MQHCDEQAARNSVSHYTACGGQSSLCSCAQGYWRVLTGPPGLQALVESVTLYPWNWGAWLDLSILCPTPAVRRCTLHFVR